MLDQEKVKLQVDATEFERAIINLKDAITRLEDTPVIIKSGNTILLEHFIKIKEITYD